MADEVPAGPTTCLEARAGPRRVLVRPGRSIIIGRDPAADIYVADQHVSRCHAVVTSTRDGWLLVDHSRNGVYVEGKRVHRLLITEKTVLVLGQRTGGAEVALTPDDGQREGNCTEGGAEDRAGPGTIPPPPRAAPTHALKSAIHEIAGVDLARITIGRLPENDIVLDDLLVSRRHAVLYRGADGWRITDVGSANGTYLNGRPVSEAPVAEGDVIGLGHALLQLVGDELVEYVDRGDVDFEARDLVVTVGSARLLDHVSFATPERSLLAVVGPSGAGKSTLMGALTGFRPADSGRVRYGGRDLYENYDELRHRIGLVPQEDILHPQLTVRPALSYAAQLRFPSDVSAQERGERIDEVLGELGLSERAGQRIDRLSGGQRKRTSVALELLTRPSLLFLDEPTSGLDPGLEKSVMRTLRGLADDGRTVVVVTHSVASLELCDRLLVLAPGGRVAYFGPPGQAIDYFGVADFADMFQLLDSEQAVNWSDRFRASSHYERYVGSGDGRSAHPSGAPHEPPHQQSALRQFAVLCRRTFDVLKADRQYAVFLGLLPLLLAGLVQMVPSATGLSAAARNIDPISVLLVMVMSAALMGTAVSIRELVKERAIYRRERAIGLSLPAYLGSKLVVLGLVTGVQAVLFSVLSMLGRQGPDGAVLLGWAGMEVAVGLVGLALASMVMGLALSAMIGNSDRGMPLLVLLVMVQLVLSGGLFPLPGKPVLEQVSWLVPARWAYGMGASTGDYNRLPLSPTPDWLWRHTATSWLVDAAALGVMTLALVAVTAVLLRRLDPSRRGTPR